LWAVAKVGYAVVPRKDARAESGGGGTDAAESTSSRNASGGGSASAWTARPVAVGASKSSCIASAQACGLRPDARVGKEGRAWLARNSAAGGGQMGGDAPS